jgi:arsenate reductase
MEVQIFGTNKSQDTKKALRFFAERRIKVHFVDLKEKGASRGELQRFVQKFGLTAMIDKTSRRYQDLGLGVVRYSDECWLETLVVEPLILRQPLTRWQQKVTLGLADSEWKLWVEAGTA